jgi:chromate transporter
MIEDEVVTRRKWIDRQHFLDIVAAINFIPGPNSTELAIHLGQLRAGFAGLLVAGICFITPAVLIILPIAWLYVRFGTLPRFQPALSAISAAIVAIVAMATFRFARTALQVYSPSLYAC